MRSFDPRAVGARVPGVGDLLQAQVRRLPGGLGRSWAPGSCCAPTRCGRPSRTTIPTPHAPWWSAS